MKLHIQEPANGYTVRHVSITDEQGRPVCRIDWQGSVKKTNDLAMKIEQFSELERNFNQARWVLQRLVEHEEYMVSMGKRPPMGCSELQQARAFIDRFGDMDAEEAGQWIE